MKIDLTFLRADEGDTYTIELDRSPINADVTVKKIWDEKSDQWTQFILKDCEQKINSRLIIDIEGSSASICVTHQYCRCQIEDCEQLETREKILISFLSKAIDTISRIMP